MDALSYYFDRYWLAALVVIGVALAAYFVYKRWDRTVIKGSGRE